MLNTAFRRIRLLIRSGSFWVGLTYAVVHVGDSWTVYSSLSNGVLSLLFVTLQYFGPGMVKSVLTLRTGNAWVHLWAYHAFAPHVLIDTPTVVGIFQLR